MTLQALVNYGSELQKARDRIEETNRTNEAVLSRLQNDLEAVRSFAEVENYEDALRNMREQDSELYKAIRAAYAPSCSKGSHVISSITAVPFRMTDTFASRGSKFASRTSTDAVRGPEK